MPRALLVTLLALLSAGCAAERPPPAYYSPPPSLAPPPPAAPYRAQTQHFISGPRPVKPIGAGVLAANAVEPYMDNQEGELRSGLRGSGIVVARTGNALLLNIRGDLLFEPNSAAISARGSEYLERIATLVRKYDSSLVVVNAYTDTTGSREHNLAVSQKRADSVVKQLTDDGVEQRRLAAKGFGDEILKIPTGPNINEPRNRRIEMRITPTVKS